MTTNELRRLLQPTQDGAIFPGEDGDYLTRYINGAIEGGDDLGDVADKLEYAIEMLRRACEEIRKLGQTDGGKLSPGGPVKVTGISVERATGMITFQVDGKAMRVQGKKGARELSREDVARIERATRLATGAIEIRAS